MTLATIAPTPQTPVSIEFLDVLEDVEDLIRQSRSKRTIQGYESDLRQLAHWLESKGHTPELPLETSLLAAYIVFQVREKNPRNSPSTVARSLSAIRWAHHQRGLPSPTDHPQIRQIMAGVSRVHATKPDRRRPLYLSELIAGLPEGDDPKAIRDRAALLLGWFGALRRSEIAALNVEDLTEHPEGLIVDIRKSKTDQTGEGAQIPIPYTVDPCPVRAVRQWVDVLGVDSGPLFRRMYRGGSIADDRAGDSFVWTLVKECAERLGLDPSDFGAHSLRAGFVSECDRMGVPPSAVRAITRHQSTAMLDLYARPGALFRDSAAAWFATS